MLDIEGDVWILLQEWTGVEARVVWCMARVASALYRVHVSSDCHSNIILSGGNASVLYLRNLGLVKL